MNQAELIKQKVEQETRLTAEVVKMIAEFESSGERAAMGFSSLNAFCMDYLKYSKGSAWRRINAVALYNRDNAVMEKYERGELNLTNASKIETVFKEAKKQNVEVPAEALFEAAQSSTRTSERKIDKVAEQHGVKRENTDSELEEALEKLKALRSHKHPGLTSKQLMLQLALEALAKEDPALRPACPGAGEDYQETRYITPKLDAYIWQRDDGQCTQINPYTGERCQETHFLEIDHFVPFALGGLTKASNLRLLCSAHNKMHAKAYGLDRSVKVRSKRKSVAFAT